MGNTYGTRPERDEDEDSAEETTGTDSRQQTLSGGGAAEVDQGLKFGDIVHDIDDSDPDDLVVVNLPDATASEWDLPGTGETLAKRDDHYPPNDDVVIVVERDVLDDYMPSWPDREEEIPLSKLNGDGVDYEVYPSRRLKLAEKK
ncbi:MULTISPECIES: hypothetical protein [Halococcus]|uniref:Uncharacterized protein n=1 Tax=Halococcus salifodinae DSM 8989 TaxID=1227456 RepID=M0MVG5_9EURY|nr:MULTISPECIES: hypothetical protein [Halococcus]EMA49328.1 hypothetical protein C450_17462 [Halococcus salifodinae DSM 8989]